MKHTLLSKVSFLVLVFVTASLHLMAYDVIVAKDGSGNFTTVQAAINAAPNNSIAPYTIFIKNGKYREKINIASTKTFLQIIGESVANTIVYYDDPATVLGTTGSASFTINANDFSAMNITFANTFGDGSQAVAVLINADRAAFKNCRLLGNQDTLYTKGSGTVKHYFYKCYIDGNVDFIFGSSVAVFDSCIIYAKARTSTGTSYITAANTPSGQTYGYVFRDCFVPANTGGTSYFLGRPWGNATGGTSAFNKAVYMNTRLPYTVSPLGWSTWDAGTITSQITYAEHKSKNIDGSLTNVSSRVAWSQQFTDADTVGYNLGNMFSGWDPYSVSAYFGTYQPEAIAVSNFRGVKGVSSSQFDWNISWPKTGIIYTLYRSDDNIAFSPVYTTTAVNDTAVNFKYIDASLPAAGNKYYYYLDASLSGFESHHTDTVLISSKQTIVSSSATISSFAQQLGTPTDPKAYTLSGVNLTGNVTVTPPENFEISNNGGTNWYTNAAPLTLIPSAGVLSSTTILVRLNALANGDYSGTIVHTSDNADNVNVAVTGTTATTVLTPVALITWPLSPAHRNVDSTAGRSSSVQANAGRMNNLILANGVQVATVPDYSYLYGQAFNSGTSTTGTWTVATGGNGGVLSRIHYQEFKVKPVDGSTIRVDSLVTNYNFFGGAGSGSNLGYRYACVWSRSNFTADSSDVTGCDSSGVAGASVTTSRTGGFNDYLYINTKSDNVGPQSRFAFTLNGNTGVTLTTGDSLTVRLYFSCGSSSAGRYGTLKNVMAKGVVLNTSPVKLVSFAGDYSNNKVTIRWATSEEINVKEYIIESSNDGVHFTEIGLLNSIGSSTGNRYQYVDERILTGTVYYRLHITDFSGKSSYSSVLKMSVPGKALNIRISPNPASGQIKLLLSAKVNAGSICIKSLEGKRLLSLQINAETSMIPVDISKLAGGIYFVEYNYNGNLITRKFVKH